MNILEESQIKILVKANKTSGDISRNCTFDCELIPALIELESLGLITISYLKHRVFGMRKIIKSPIATLTDAGVVIVKDLIYLTKRIQK